MLVQMWAKRLRKNAVEVLPCVRASTFQGSPTGGVVAAGGVRVVPKVTAASPIPCCRVPHPSVFEGCALLLSLLTFADSLRFTYVQREIVLERPHSCPRKNIDREQQLQTYFTQAGCAGTALTLDQPKHSSFGNVVCTLPGARLNKK